MVYLINHVLNCRDYPKVYNAGLHIQFFNPTILVEIHLAFVLTRHSQYANIIFRVSSSSLHNLEGNYTDAHYDMG